MLLNLHFIIIFFKIDSFLVLDLVKKVGTITENNIGESIDMTELFANLILTQSLPFMNIDVDIARESSEFILQVKNACK